jgi:fructose-bisphosphate aldolase class II
VALIPFTDLMSAAERGGYGVGYFEAWSLESLLAVADAAERTRSPVILGFSGLYLPSPARRLADPLAAYSSMGLAVAEGLSVPACVLFNESPYLDSVLDAIRLNFGIVMYTDEAAEASALEARTRQVVALAHERGAAVEGEVTPLAGVGGELDSAPADARLTEPDSARGFVERTDVDALAVNVGQAHLHGRRTVRLDLERIATLKRAVSVPLVLHGASSVDRHDLSAAIAQGVRKINVGSVLKQAYFRALRDACQATGESVNPYEVIGSGLESDVLVAGRLAMQEVVERMMSQFGSAGRAAGRAEPR